MKVVLRSRAKIVTVGGDLRFIAVRYVVGAVKPLIATPDFSASFARMPDRIQTADAI